MAREPFGDGTIYALIPDPAAALFQAEIKAWIDEHGRATLDPDLAALPRTLINADGQYDVPSYVALLAEVVRQQGWLLGQLLHERGVPRPPGPATPSPYRPAPRPTGRHAAP